MNTTPHEYSFRYDGSECGRFLVVAVLVVVVYRRGSYPTTKATLHESSICGEQ